MSYVPLSILLELTWCVVPRFHVLNMHEEELHRMGIHQEIQSHEGEGFCELLWRLLLLNQSNHATTANAGNDIITLTSEIV